MHTLEQLRSGQLAGSTRLDLCCGLDEFPAEIFTLADSLEVLNLSGNRLSSLPEDLPRLHKLRVLFCSDNQFQRVPEVLGQCAQLEMVGFKANQIRELPARALPRNLRWLILTDNQLETLPPELGQCPRLQKLMLAGNQLRELPDSLSECKNLELLRIAANQLSELPQWLGDLPRLAWLAFAGNPFCLHAESAALCERPIKHIDWQALTLGKILGEGASGVIQQAQWQTSATNTQQVAVKRFKGALTSDGLPQSEMAASIAAGQHANLIAVHGKLINQPDNTPGLLLELIDTRFNNLAGPPSLESCTRDIYPNGSQFDLNTLLAISLSMAKACAHLHERGINHGDLYGHNILHDGQGNCLLGDFGAASLLGASHPGQAESLQRIEVRAFACLLEELLERCPTSPSTDVTIKALWALQTVCSHSNPRSRPLFATIVAHLVAAQHPHL